MSRERRPIFASPELRAICLDALEETRAKHAATIHAYCVMPDHVHVLVEIEADVSLQKFARLFKQLSGYRLRQSLGGFAWQTSYYDHILRSDEAILDVVAYIWENPVKAGLADSVSMYPGSGPRNMLLQV